MWHNYMTSRTGSRNARTPPQSAKEPFRAYARAYTHAYTRAYAHAYARAYAHARAYTHACAHAAQFVRHGKGRAPLCCPLVPPGSPLPRLKPLRIRFVQNRA